VSKDQLRVIRGWLEATGRHDLKILEAGCGSGWLCEAMSHYGRVTGVDLSDQVLSRAARRMPQVRFEAGDFMALEFEPDSFDAVVSVETLSHLPDQPAFVKKLAAIVKPGGSVMIATQNRPVLERSRFIRPVEPGQLRRWVDRHELSEMIEAAGLELEDLFSITPKFDSGPMKLVTSEKVLKPLSKAGLGPAVRAMTRAQEKAWLGWTLMARARKPA